MIKRIGQFILAWGVYVGWELYPTHTVVILLAAAILGWTFTIVAHTWENVR